MDHNLSQLFACPVRLHVSIGPYACESVEGGGSLVVRTSSTRSCPIARSVRARRSSSALRRQRCAASLHVRPVCETSGRNPSPCHRLQDRSLQALPTAARGGRSQQVRHPFVAGPVTRPSFGGGVMAIVPDRLVDTVIDEKPHGVLVHMVG